MISSWLNIPTTLPAKIFTLREGSFATDLFITAVSHFNFFNRLDESSSDIDTICKSLGIKKRPTDVMLTLFKAYGFIKEKRGKYYLSDVSKDYLTSKSGFDLTSYVSSLRNRPICKDLKKVLQTGRPVNWAAAKEGKDWATSMQNDDFAESFTAAMNSRGGYLARGLLKVIDLQSYQNILDIGGASGIYSAILLEKYHGLHSTIFEKLPVDKAARYSVNKLGLASRIDVLAGDMFRDSFPEGYDIHFLSHILHDWDVNKVKIVLANSFRSLNPGGRIIIHDAHINKSKTGPVSVAEYSVLLMALSEGKCYSITEMKNLLEEAGFKNIEYKSTVLNRSIITAKK
ncbi:MAG: methyltransferase [Dehalococcoidales bacterium]|nr:methyltransferase [Dehalococcoidales bacterium]